MVDINLVGHGNTKRQIAIAQSSAIERNSSLPHMLFVGSPGCGKTSMAKEVARINNTDLLSIIPESLKDFNSIKKLLSALNHDGYDKRGNRIDRIQPSIIFIDEIHRLPMYGQEKLGIAMENWLLETGRANKYNWIPYFTLIGATTLSGDLSKPFLNRFKLNIDFHPYSLSDSIKIIQKHALRLTITISLKAAKDIAIRGRGIPRIMISYLERCRDLALSLKAIVVTTAITNQTFQDLGIDKMGLTNSEVHILKTLYSADKAIGLETLAVIINKPAKIIKLELEPFLMQKGLMIRSGTGRVITPTGRDYIESQENLNFHKVEISATYERQ